MEQKMLMNISGELDNEKVLVRQSVMYKGEACPLHWHDYFEFEIIISGKGNHIHNDKNYDIRPGMAYLMSYYDFHSLRADTDIEMINIRFGENILSEELTRFIALGGGRFNSYLTKEETEYILERIKKLDAEKKDNQSFCDIMTGNILSEIIITLIRKADSSDKGAMPTLIQKTVSHIYLNFRNEISLETTANELSVSVNYLGAVFKKAVGVSFNDYLNMTRLKYACNLLLSSKMSVKEIAFESGYNSVEYFLYVFKRKLNMTPTAYRKQGK